MFKKLVFVIAILFVTSFAFQSCEREKTVSPPPSEIEAYVEANYPDATIIIVTYDKWDKEYEVTLSNGWELTFDKSFNLIDADR